jgi:hypothetical protein
VTKALDLGMLDVRKKLHSYGTIIDDLADGNGVVICEGGLLTRAIKAPAAILEPVKVVLFRPGKVAGQAILSWPEAKGAGSYEVELNFTPETGDAGPWTALTAAANLSRVVTAPAPRAQFLARVAAVGHDGTKAPWSPTVLVFAA